MLLFYFLCPYYIIYNHSSYYRTLLDSIVEIKHFSSVNLKVVTYETHYCNLRNEDVEESPDLTIYVDKSC